MIPSSTSVIVCEAVLIEKTDVQSAIRIMNMLRLAPETNVARFKVLTIVHSQPGDVQAHILSVQMQTTEGAIVAKAQDHPFVYGNKIDPHGPRTYALTTDFTLDLTPLGSLGYYLIWAFVDGTVAGGAPLMLRRELL